MHFLTYSIWWITIIFLPICKAYSACDQSFTQKILHDSLELLNSVENGLQSSRPKEQIRALQEIRQLEPDGAEFYEKILPLLKSTEPEVRKEASLALSKVKDINRPVFQTLLQAKSLENNEMIKKNIQDALMAVTQNARKLFVHTAKPIVGPVESLDQYPALYIRIIHQSNIENVNSPSTMKLIQQMYKEGKLFTSAKITPQEEKDIDYAAQRLHSMVQAGAGRSLTAEELVHFITTYKSINEEIKNLQKTINYIKPLVKTAKDFIHIVQMYRVSAYGEQTRLNPALLSVIEQAYDS